MAAVAGEQGKPADSFLNPVEQMLSRLSAWGIKIEWRLLIFIRPANGFGYAAVSGEK